jgi:hypothetical protein
MTPILLSPNEVRMTSKAVFSSTASLHHLRPQPQHRDGSRGAHAPFFFESFDEVCDLKDGKSAQLFH